MRKRNRFLQVGPSCKGRLVDPFLLQTRQGVFPPEPAHSSTRNRTLPSSSSRSPHLTRTISSLTEPSGWTPATELLNCQSCTSSQTSKVNSNKPVPLSGDASPSVSDSTHTSQGIKNLSPFLHIQPQLHLRSWSNHTHTGKFWKLPFEKKHWQSIKDSLF